MYHCTVGESHPRYWHSAPGWPVVALCTFSFPSRALSWRQASPHANTSLTTIRTFVWSSHSSQMLQLMRILLNHVSQGGVIASHAAFARSVGFSWSTNVDEPLGQSDLKNQNIQRCPWVDRLDLTTGNYILQRYQKNKQTKKQYYVGVP